MKLYTTLAILIFLGCRTGSEKVETQYPSWPKTKTLVRFSNDGLYYAQHDTTIDILKVDTVPGEIDTSYYIEYIDVIDP